jgi:hypothetical protein
VGTRAAPAPPPSEPAAEHSPSQPRSDGRAAEGRQGALPLVQPGAEPRLRHGAAAAEAGRAAQRAERHRGGFRQGRRGQVHRGGCAAQGPPRDRGARARCARGPTTCSWPAQPPPPARRRRRAVNIAASLALHEGLRVGLMDADIHGPSVPTMMNLRGRPDATEGALPRAADAPAGAHAGAVPRCCCALPRGPTAGRVSGPPPRCRRAAAAAAQGELPCQGHVYGLLHRGAPPGCWRWCAAGGRAARWRCHGWRRWWAGSAAWASACAGCPWLLACRLARLLPAVRSRVPRQQEAPNAAAAAAAAAAGGQAGGVARADGEPHDRPVPQRHRVGAAGRAGGGPAAWWAAALLLRCCCLLSAACCARCPLGGAGCRWRRGQRPPASPLAPLAHPQARATRR